MVTIYNTTLSATSQRHFSDGLGGGACPKNAPSGASTPSRVAQKADRALNCGLIGQPGGGVSLSKCRRDDGYCNMQTEWEASEYWFGMTYAWVGKKVGPYLSLSLSDFSSFAGFIGVNWRMTDPHSDTMDWQLYGGLGLAEGCFAVDGGMRFGWRSSALVSKWDFGVGLHYHKGAITPTINFGFYIWGIPVIVGVGLVCHALL